VELQSITRNFGSVTALSNFSLTIEPGEMVALLGPSGCGKTTALRALAGLEDIDAGTIVIDDADVSDLPAHKRDMAMVFQAYSLMPHMTVRQNLEFVLKIRKISPRERTEITTRYLDMVGLTGHAEHFPHQLSGGQRQRVAIARALAVDPKVLLLDEPLSALDAKVRVQLREEIRALQLDSGITALFVTHDQEEALAMADRVAVMYQGKIAQIGAPQEIYERPESEFVARFIGQVNDIPCTVETGQAVTAYGRVPLLEWSATDAQTVLVRPENIAIEATDAPVGHSNTAVIEQFHYLGSVASVAVRSADGLLLHAQVPAREGAELVLGATVSVHLRRQAALAV
jgi:putative spermidine/putrescine transport system ATP-binding protein